MNLHILYFGLIAEKLSLQEEFVDNMTSQTVHEFQNWIEQKHPAIQGLSYRIAVNQNLAQPEDQIPNEAEIALLPPFAGG